MIALSVHTVRPNNVDVVDKTFIRKLFFAHSHKVWMLIIQRHALRHKFRLTLEPTTSTSGAESQWRRRSQSFADELSARRRYILPGPHWYFHWDLQHTVLD